MSIGRRLRRYRRHGKGAEWEASGVSGGDEGYVRIPGLGMMGTSLDNTTHEAKTGIDEPVLELILFPVFWCGNGAGVG
jgi:hypothetical protein